VVDGLDRFDGRLQVEARQRIFRGGRAPNLDCLLIGSDLVFGVESKLTEMLTRHGSGGWSDAYRRESCRALLSDGWLQTLESALSDDYHPQFLGADQLLKHALGISKQHPDRARHLVYVYWEPTDADLYEEFVQHRAEVAEFGDRIAGSSPSFHALTYAELWQQWETLSDEEWLRDHLRALRARYEISLSE
jgi:hypothetical protein